MRASVNGQQRFKNINCAKLTAKVSIHFPRLSYYSASLEKIFLTLGKWRFCPVKANKSIFFFRYFATGFSSEGTVSTGLGIYLYITPFYICRLFPNDSLKTFVLCFAFLRFTGNPDWIRSGINQLRDYRVRHDQKNVLQ